MTNMQINKIDVGCLNVPFIHPVKVPLGIINSANNVVVKITSNTGLVGWGEASPMTQITGDSQQSNYAMAQSIAKILIGKNPLSINTRMAEVNYLTIGEPSIRSAFDIALHDLAAKAANMPLYQYLGGEPRELRTNLTIGMQDSVEGTVSMAQKILDAGFNAIKLKVGRPGLEDVAHVSAVRQLVGPNITIKIDSNQGWDYPTAVMNLTVMEPLNLQYSEQPLVVWDHDNMARLRNKFTLPICADESIFTHHDALKLIKANAVDYLNIKLGKAGGISTSLKINAISEAAGKKCMIGCFAETRLGLSAAAHLAMAKPNITFLDLDSVFHLDSDPVIGGIRYDKKIGGLIHISEGLGHGAEFIEEQIENIWSIEQ